MPFLAFKMMVNSVRLDERAVSWFLFPKDMVEVSVSVSAKAGGERVRRGDASPSAATFLSVREEVGGAFVTRGQLRFTHPFQLLFSEHSNN